MDLRVDIKQAKREVYKLRGRFLKLQRTMFGEALTESAAPIVAAAKSAAPRRTGLLQLRIQSTKPKMFRGRLGVAVTPVRNSKREKNYPFYGRFQELGWKATGRANRKTAKNPKQIPGKHFLRDAGVRNFATAERIFAARVFASMKEIQSAGEAAGLV